jgi:hypothetical protein
LPDQLRNSTIYLYLLRGYILQGKCRLLGENSELRELWEEGDAEEWLGSIAALQKAIA